MAREATEARKKPGETDLQWQIRILQDAQDRRDKDGPIVTPEAERHGNYDDGFVMHVETQTLAYTKRNRSISSLVRMHDHGRLTDDQFVASQKIVAIAERIGRQVDIRGAKLDARVDNSGSSQDVLCERLQQVRDEIAYSRWRSRLPIPRRMVLDMLLLNQPMAATARKYKLSWPTARTRLVRALDLFIEIHGRVSSEVDEDDLKAAQARAQR